ncbi:MAG TPA: carbohydrate kinase family protein, partial [Candidatus Saccharibacteria bacterium]|nr:carbohydrate kinase family protein [Candidatus Saccharibacteria bacterium]
MVRISALGAASQDVFITGQGIKAELDPRTNEHMEEFSEEFKLGAKLNVDTITFATGGGATNASVTFARQGLESRFVGKLGNDVAAHGVIQELDKELIDTHIIHHDSLGTQYSTILLADTGERTILVYRGAANTHTPADYQDINFDEDDWIYVSSFAGALDALDVIFDKAVAAGVKVAFNPGDKELSEPDKLKGLLEDVEVLIVNKEEAQKIVEGVSLEELARHLLHYVPVAIVSDGPNGVVASDGKTIVTAGMYEDVEVIDRTGAGDAFGSGFVSYWAQGKSLKESIVFASANSTSVV